MPTGRQVRGAARSTEGVYESPMPLAATGRIKRVPRVPRVRLVLAALMGWTLLHLILWSCAETPFQIGSTYRLSESVSYNYDGFWPLKGRGITLVRRREEGYAKEIPIASLKVYDATEFVFYVGGPWTLFAIFLLLRKKDDAGPNVPIIDGKAGVESMGDLEGNEDSIRK